MSTPKLNLTVAGTSETIDPRPTQLVIAGYTGRDEAAVREHIDELAAQGIAPPPRVPMRYDLDPALLSTATTVAIDGAKTSGEVEPVLLRHRRRWYLGVGSDHTDRELEREDIATSKAACPKPIGPTVVALPDGVTDGALDEAWDAITVQCTVDGDTYQSGALTALRTPSDLLTHLSDALTETAPDDDLAVFAGTLPLLGGTFRFGRDWTLTLHFAPHTLTHHYSIA